MEFDIGNVTLNDDSISDAQKICYLQGITTQGDNDYDGHLSVRVSALFVIFVTASLATFFPVVAKRVRWMRIPLGVYLFARYFGAGVIVATAYIHLLDPAYSAIGPNTCVGMTGGWSEYSFVPAIVLVTLMLIFFLDFGAKLYVEKKYGMVDDHGTHDPEQMITAQTDGVHTHNGHLHDAHPVGSNSQSTHIDEDERGIHTATPVTNKEVQSSSVKKVPSMESLNEKDETLEKSSFEQQIAAFYILEFGVIFHSVMIGLNLAVAGWEDFKILYVVIIFHQAFEGLGVGARLSSIPFPRGRRNMPWYLCAAYGLTTPLAIAVGLGVRKSYNPGSFEANIVSGVLDSISAGILIYTGLVELMAADFLFNPQRTKSVGRLSFMLGSLVLGAFIMALLGKWA